MIVSLTRLVGFVSDNAVDVLFDDQWDYLGPLFRGEGPLASFFYQHGPPRMGLGGWLEWYLYNATGWDVRAVAWLALAVLTLAACTAILLSSRLRGRIKWTDAAFPLLIVNPIHWESMILTPSVAPMILPLLLTFLIGLGWATENLKLRIATVSIVGGLNLFTGYGACSAPVILGLTLLLGLRPSRERVVDERWAAGWIILLISSAIFFFAWGYHWAPGVPGWRFPVPNWWDYPRFCALMFTSLLGFRSVSWAATALGVLVLLLVVTVFTASSLRIWKHDAEPRTRTIWFLTAVSLTYAALTAIGRLPINIEAAFMWRYMTLMTPALCALGLAAEEWKGSRYILVTRFFAPGWVLLAAVVWGNFSPERYAGAIAMAKRKWVASYLISHDLKRANADSQFWVYYPEPNSIRIAEQLRWLEQRRLSFFHSSPSINP